jgi:hypothetical protein
MPDGHTMDERVPDRPESAVERSDRHCRAELSWPARVAHKLDEHWRVALTMLLIGDLVLLMYMGRGLSFFYDEWDWVTHDYGGGWRSLMQAHVGNISIFPVAVYKVLFHLVGLNHYAVFRLAVIFLHLIAAGLIFALAARRVGRVPALLAMSLILFLGAAWEDLLWAFQIGYMLSIVGGLGAWALIERDGRGSDMVAMLCTVIAVGSSSLGIPIVIALGVELMWARRWRRLWIAAVPAVLYALWYLSYGESQMTANSVINAPGFAADLTASAFGALVGHGLDWGRPLAIAAIVLTLIRLGGHRSVRPRLAGLLAAGLSLWAITALARSTISSPEASRYTYMGAVIVVLVGVELLRDIRLPAKPVVIAIPIVAYLALTGLTPLHAGADGLRGNSKVVTAELGALEIASAYAPPGYQPDPQRAPQITAGPYLHTVRAIGSSPADSVPALMASAPPERAAADVVLRQIYVPSAQSISRRPRVPLAPEPSVLSVARAIIGQSGACATLNPSQKGTPASAILALPTGGISMQSAASSTPTLAMTRFGEVFANIPLANSHGAWDLHLPTDSASSLVPWRLRVEFTSRLVLCGLEP